MRVAPHLRFLKVCSDAPRLRMRFETGGVAALRLLMRPGRRSARCLWQRRARRSRQGWRPMVAVVVLLGCQVWFHSFVDGARLQFGASFWTRTAGKRCLWCQEARAKKIIIAGGRSQWNPNPPQPVQRQKESPKNVEKRFWVSGPPPRVAFNKTWRAAPPVAPEQTKPCHLKMTSLSQVSNLTLFN